MILKRKKEYEAFFLKENFLFPISLTGNCRMGKKEEVETQNLVFKLCVPREENLYQASLVSDTLIFFKAALPFLDARKYY